LFYLYQPNLIIMTQEEIQNILNENTDEMVLMLARAFERLQSQLQEMETRLHERIVSEIKNIK